jgi:hypothetical protein
VFCTVLWCVSFSFGRIFFCLLATFSSEAGLFLLVNPLAPSIINIVPCTWNLLKQLKAFKLGVRFLTGYKLGERQEGERIQLIFTERALLLAVNVRKKSLMVAFWSQP